LTVGHAAWTGGNLPAFFGARAVRIFGAGDAGSQPSAGSHDSSRPERGGDQPGNRHPTVVLSVADHPSGSARDQKARAQSGQGLWPRVRASTSGAQYGEQGNQANRAARVEEEPHDIGIVPRIPRRSTRRIVV